MLSPIQKKLFDFIRDEIAKTGRSPSYSQIGAAMGCSPAGARFGVQRLQKYGYITRQFGVTGSIKIIKEG
jgi:SOS-response transcriptional repressor LexA